MKVYKLAACVVGVYVAAQIFGIFANKNRQKAKNLPVHILKNSNGIEVHILEIGCVIQKLFVPDANGRFEDIVLGFDQQEPYLDGTSPYFGAVVGRVANRIARAAFVLDGHTYRLYANNHQASLHGGKVGFDKRFWTPRNYTVDGVQHLELKYTSPGGEEGYPGELNATVTYSLTDDNTLHLAMEATTNKKTIVNLAQHSYFNLGGHGSGSILNHNLKIYGDHITPVNSELIPTGDITPVEGTPFDFQTVQCIGDRIKEVPGGFDHNFVLFGLGKHAAAKCHQGAVSDKPQIAATVHDPATGRAMDISTTSPGLQLYTGNFLDGSFEGKQNTRYYKHGALCLETQNFPDAIHHDNFPSVVLEAGQKYTHLVSYRFYTFKSQF